MPKHGVPGRMTGSIVDVLEASDVQLDDADASRPECGNNLFGFEEFIELRAIGQLGQGVMGGRETHVGVGLAQLLLCPHQGGDVPAGHDDFLRLRLGGVTDQRKGLLHAET